MLMNETEEKEGLLHPGERLDDLQRDGYRIIQNGKYFCFGMDAVLLSAFACIKPGERMLDLGTGTGVIPILLRARTGYGPDKGNAFTGLEINEYCADMAQRSVRFNQIEDNVRIVQGDIRKADQTFAGGSFDVITSNPPYMIAGHGFESADPCVAAARTEVLCTLEDVVCQASRLLKEQGRFYMVHRPFRMAEIICMLTKHRLEPKRIRLVYPFVDREPNMLLIEARKGGRPRVSAEPPLIIYESKGVYTREVRELYNMQQDAGKDPKRQSGGRTGP